MMSFAYVVVPASFLELKTDLFDMVVTVLVITVGEHQLH